MESKEEFFFSWKIDVCKYKQQLADSLTNASNRDPMLDDYGHMQLIQDSLKSMLRKMLKLGAGEALKQLDSIFSGTDPIVAVVPFKTISKRYETVVAFKAPACVS